MNKTFGVRAGAAELAIRAPAKTPADFRNSRRLDNAISLQPI
jgi:hypothetical protein